MLDSFVANTCHRQRHCRRHDKQVSESQQADVHGRCHHCYRRRCHNKWASVVVVAITTSKRDPTCRHHCCHHWRHNEQARDNAHSRCHCQLNDERARAVSQRPRAQQCFYKEQARANAPPPSMSLLLSQRASKSLRAVPSKKFPWKSHPLPPQPPQVITMNIMFTQQTKNMIYLPAFWGLYVCKLTCTEQTEWIVQSVWNDSHRAAKMYCTICANWIAQRSQNGVCELTRTAASSGQKFKVAYFWKLKHCFLVLIFSVEEIWATKFLFVKKWDTNRAARENLKPVCEWKLNRTNLG